MSNPRPYIMKKYYSTLFIVLGLCFTSYKAFPQESIVVSGTVTSEDGVGIPGVTVSLSGTSIGTATDLEGKYSLSVPEGSTLVYSFIGFATQNIEVGDRSIIDVTLREDISSLDEVIVVGYGTQKKVNLTGAVAQVGGEELAHRPVANVGQALQGVIGNLNITPSGSGGTPGAAPN